MAERWRLVVRDGAIVRKSTLVNMESALMELQAETAQAAGRPTAEPVGFVGRDFAPEDLVVMRAQLRGPERFVSKVRCGIDVRGDGTLEPWIGGSKRRQVEPRKREDAWQALRRELGVT